MIDAVLPGLTRHSSDRCEADTRRTFFHQTILQLLEQSGRGRVAFEQELYAQGIIVPRLRLALPFA